MTPKLLRSAIAAALYGGAAFLPLTALAQATEDPTTLDRIEVTGSRIKRVDAETTQPVQVITRADIEKSGINNVFDILNSITSSDGSGLSTVTTQTNGSDGSQQISLRGIGADRTLILVDGKRWVTDIDQTVDLSTIPVAIIERIDVLKDGASAIYGSDAIAGVINIITRKHYDGAQVGFSYGQTAQGDGARTSADLTIGAASERSSGVMSLSFSDQETIMAGDREISSVPYFGNYVYGYEGGDCLAILAGAADPFGLGTFCGSPSGVYGSFTGPGVATQSLRPGANINDGITPADFVPFNNTQRYNFAPINYLQQPAKRANIYAYGRFDITDNISAYARATYTKRTSSQQLAEVPLSVNNGGGNGPQWAFQVAGDNPATLAIEPSHLYNPWGTVLNTASYRMAIAGGRRSSYDFDVFGVQLGLEGSFSIGERYFNWDLMAQRNDGQYDRIGENYINLFNLKNALGPSGYDSASDTLYCGTSFATRIRGCVPFNIFGGPTLGLGAPVPGAGNGRRINAADVQAMLDYITYTQVSTAGNTTTNYTGNLSGDLFELPAGVVGFALGFETRRDETFEQPDTLVSSGGSSDNYSEPTRGYTKVTEYFLEVVAPLLKDQPFAKELELSAAVRKSDYEAAGFVGSTFVPADPGSPTNKKFGLRWKPTDDLLFRASWGETFRAPSANDLYAGGAESFPQANDPCRATNWANLNAAQRGNCQAAGVPVGGAPQLSAQIRALVGGNALLQPEFGKNWTAGVVYSPRWLEGFDITLDYWNVDLVDAQAAYAVNTVLNRCYTFANQDGSFGIPAFCPFVERAADGSVSVVRSGSINASSFQTSGVDLGLAYTWDAEEWGTFRFKWDTTYVRDRITQLDATAPALDAIGFYDGSPNWEWRSQLDVDWTRGDWSARWTTRYVSDIYENCFTYCNSRDSDPPIGSAENPFGRNHLGGYAVHDLQLAWKAPWDATVAVGGRNIFGREPPIVTNNTFAHNFDAAYDLPGGAYWYAQYRQDF